jgi:hypothetical protein
MVFRKREVPGSVGQPPVSVVPHVSKEYLGHFSATSDSDRTRDRSFVEATTAVVRRTLVPLLQEMVFSDHAIGRLSSGVAAEMTRHDSAEQYRRSGGR